jgi:hypothetical protein
MENYFVLAFAPVRQYVPALGSCLPRLLAVSHHSAEDGRIIKKEEASRAQQV